MSSRFGNSEGFKAIHLTDKNGARSNGSVSSPPWLGHFTSERDAATVGVMQPEAGLRHGVRWESYRWRVGGSMRAGVPTPSFLG